MQMDQADWNSRSSMLSRVNVTFGNNVALKTGHKLLRNLALALVLMGADLAYLLNGHFPPIYSFRRDYVWVDDHTVRPALPHEQNGVTREKVCIYFTGVSLREAARAVDEKCPWFVVR